LTEDLGHAAGGQGRAARSTTLLVVLVLCAVVGLLIPTYERAHLVTQKPYSWCPQNTEAAGNGSTDSYSMSVLPFGITCIYEPKIARSGTIEVYHDLGSVPGAIGVLALLGVIGLVATRIIRRTRNER
jgi:hypothetical protein